MDTLPSVGIFSKVIPDVDGVSPFFVSTQLYSPEVEDTKEKVFQLLSEARKKGSDPLSKFSVCSSSTLLDPCSAGQRLRILKLGKMDSIRLPEHRSAIFTILEQISVVSEVFPLEVLL